MLKRCIKEFGTIEDVRAKAGSFFLLPDGKYLNVESSHDDIIYCLATTPIKHTFDAMEDFYKKHRVHPSAHFQDETGSIRVNAGRHAVFDMSLVTPPTEVQLEVIRDVCDRHLTGCVYDIWRRNKKLCEGGVARSGREFMNAYRRCRT